MTSIGIDLGTTNSSVARKKNQVFDILPSKQDERLTQSFVYVENGLVYVGASAYKQSSKNPQNGIYEIKRLIGYDYDDVQIKEDKKWLFYKIIRGKNNEIFIDFGELRLTPLEISAIILYKLKKDAEEKLKRELNNVVVCVPAYFNSTQKAATKLAAIFAGFKEVQLLNEPTAAALCYLQENEIETSEFILVYDLGGGTFDVSIIEVNVNDVKVVSVNGDSHLGGELFLRNLIKLVKEKIQKKYPNVKFDVNSDRKLRNECEEAKKQLSNFEEYNIVLDCFKSVDSVDVVVTREEFEKRNDSLFKKTVSILKDCIKISKIPKEKIKKVLLVGGASKTPKVKQLLNEYFECDINVIETDINADEAVAIGAAIQADQLFSQLKKTQLKVRDVLPMSLFIRINDSELIQYIEKNSPIPLNKTAETSISNIKETFFQLSFFEGDSKDAQKNFFLGAKKIHIKGKPTKFKLTIVVEEGEVFKFKITGACIQDEEFELQISGHQNLSEEDILARGREICQKLGN